MSDKKDDKSNMANPAGSGLLSDIRKAGILRKLKTMKKKYFVLRTESDSGPARLEYYDSEKKYKAGGVAKRSISIKTCFNINRKIDAKHKFAIALYTKDDCFSVVTDNENSREDWLNAMLELQLDGPCMNGGAKLKPKFEHVWQVTVGDKSLASSRNMKGLYRLCLTPSALALVKVDQSDNPETLEFPLMSIRRCGHTNNYFVIELGRSSVTGAGELWLETEDVVIAQNMHEVTLNAMKSCREHEDLGPLSRPRSASNSENSRPIATRRPVAVVSPQTISYGGIRDRCDSMPSRSRTISEGQQVNNRGIYSHQFVYDSLRPHNSSYSRTVSCSPPGNHNPLSPSSNDSAGSSLSIDEFDAGQQTDFAHGRYIHCHPTDGALHTEPPIKEEQLDDYVPMSVGNCSSTTDGYLSMAPISSSVPTSMSLHLNTSDAISYPSSLPSITQPNDYMEMKSPTEGYINMSPLSIAATSNELNTSKLSSSMDIVNNDSSQVNDGYIPMAPIRDHCSSISSTSTTHDGYLDMAPLSSSLPKTFSVISNHSTSMSSRKDSNSKLSDTPVSTPSSTNLEDFPLDKVKSFLADPDDSSCDSYIRPVRAYSMGSRPQPKKSHLPVQLDGSRIRAYSVGSQAAQKRITNPAERELNNFITIDPRTGAKSSSAPLLNNRPPRVRSSASRGDVGEDLMEIDYNRLKYSSCGIDFCDSNFTIEPVGRSRSGSYSSSTNAAIKILHDRDKSKSHSIGQSCSDDTQLSSDYLQMSPVGDSLKSLSRSPASSICSPSTLLSNTSTAARQNEPMHPSGDYVSLDPTSTYQKLENSPMSSLSKGFAPAILRNSRSRSPHSSLSSTLSHLEEKSQNNSNKDIYEHNAYNNQQLSTTKDAASDYMCMNFSQNGAETNSSLQAKKLTTDHSSPKISRANFEKQLVEPKPVKKCPLPPLPQVNESSKLPSPDSKSPSPQLSGSVSSKFEPKTPPPSPCYGAISPQLSGAPLVENLVRRLSQPSYPGGTPSDTNSCSNSVCGEVRLNYASLDLPPASDDDAKLVCNRLKKSLEGETKEAPLTYAQIDFSPVKKQKAFQDTESLSHL
ncbi:insulin receptor substrate 1 isoform X1 [Parasteatoda tepidariorum]